MTSPNQDNQTAVAITTWANNQGEEDAMNDDHYPLWAQMIRHISEPSLQDATVLDFGCNQGGFLRLLAKEKPFKQGVGVDIAAASVKDAQARSPAANLEYRLTDTLATEINRYDMAFSHEVIYLLPDLAAHAKQIRQVLKNGGVYYAAIGCHTDNPLWADWVTLISSYSTVPVQNYSLDDYANAFFDEGFKVSAKPYAFTDFVPLKHHNPYFPKVSDSLNYYTVQKTLFRFQNQK
jgi:SAM-dependent methyltransferase